LVRGQQQVEPHIVVKQAYCRKATGRRAVPHLFLPDPFANAHRDLIVGLVFTRLRIRCVDSLANWL
jgi:hypothetical protein